MLKLLAKWGSMRNTNICRLNLASFWILCVGSWVLVGLFLFLLRFRKLFLRKNKNQLFRNWKMVFRQPNIPNPKQDCKNKVSKLLETKRYHFMMNFVHNILRAEMSRSHSLIHIQSWRNNWRKGNWTPMCRGRRWMWLIHMSRRKLWGKIFRVGKRKMLYRHRTLSSCRAKWRAIWGIEPTMPWTRPRKISSRETAHPPSGRRCGESWRQPKTTQVIMNSDLFLTL